MILISDEDLERFLREDVPYGDLTTRSLGLNGRRARISFRAGAEMVAACPEEAGRLLRRLGCGVEDSLASGARVAAGTLLLAGEGPAEAAFAAWKVAQTLMEYASGIATAAAGIVAAARAVQPGVVVACTRKACPGTRAVAVKAILAGGAVPHRLGLSDTLLLFPEHLAVLADQPLEAAIARLKAACPEKKVVVEVTSVAAAEAAARHGADVVQLEKFPPDQVAEVVRRLAGTTALVAAAGGVNAGNAAAYAAAGARILVTSAPYAARPLDVKVAFQPGAPS
ncbi:nicotinate-nucleotide pyrophosphorylase [mine drainage metagenome]|uniref:Putative pyrophosphorylase ModD n=1 Tax=mine drainage metagenome TaxID=410659 RepID=A0A1J5QBI8_9ZZZZ